MLTMRRISPASRNESELQMMRRSVSILVMLCVAAVPAMAQTRPFNAAGVTTGHEHLAGTDAASHNAFWTALGAVPAQLGTNQILKIPGVFIMFQNAGARGGGGGVRGAAAPAGAPATTAPPPAAPGPSEGSSVEHLAFKVKSLKDTLENWTRPGRSLPQRRPQPRHLYWRLTASKFNSSKTPHSRPLSRPMRC